MSLTIRPKNWASWDFYVERDGQRLAFVDLAWVREAATMEIGGVVCRFYRDGMLGDFVMEVDGQPVVRADKTSVFTRRFDVLYGERSFVLKPASGLARRFLLIEDDATIGEIRPKNMFTRKADVDLPADLPAEVQIFIIWLVVIMWQRTAKSSG